MLSIPRFSTSSGLDMEWLGEALLNWGFLRMGLNLRRDIGLAPRQKGPSGLGDWHR